MAGRRTINGRYELERPLASGGMGEVWAGRDTRLDREIAVKLIRFPDGKPDPELVRRLVRESRIAARLEHPGVPAVYDVGTHEGRPYIVMQRVRGISVADLVAELGPLPIGWAAAIAAQVCAVLTVAHRASLVHRDLKPANLMLTPDGSVKVLDFGLAVALDMSDYSRITRTGQTLGTPSYMAPEQILAGLSSPRTDLYGLGCTLHEMLTGRPLFSGSTAYAVMNRQVDEPPASVRGLRAEVPVELDRLVLALLRKKPEERPDSAVVVYQRLLPFVTDLTPLPELLDPPSLPSPTRMYAEVLSRVYAEGAVSPGDTAPSVQPADRPDQRHGYQTNGTTYSEDRGHADRAFDSADVDRARAEAHSLVRESRYSQAAEVLTAVVGPASRALGSSDPAVLSLRLDLADTVFVGHDYRRAAALYQQLAADLAGHDGPDSDRVFHCRLREATCDALVGKVSQALRKLEILRTDEERVYGADAPPVLELREQIALLLLASGRRTEAEEALRALLAEQVRYFGTDHAATVRTRNLLASLRRMPPPQTGSQN